ALRAGAAWFLVKPTPPKDLIGLVQVAAEGHTVLSPAAARRRIGASFDRQPARDRPAPGRVAHRPRGQVLACLGEGLSNAQIAARLYLSEARVKGYVSRMLDKLGCANRAQAGLLAHDAPVSSARSPGRRSCRLELGLGARQAGLRPSPGRSYPPGAAGLTGPPRAGGCCDHVVDAVGDELLQDQRMHGVLLG
ncbi:MAG: response regulator transcription factor, partial [Streptosporangiaceae bacterium]